jgi:hypothetical protein
MALLSIQFSRFPTVYRKGKPARLPAADIADNQELVASNEKAMEPQNAPDYRRVGDD